MSIDFVSWHDRGMPRSFDELLSAHLREDKLPPADDPFLAACMGIQDMAMLLLASYTAHSVDRNPHWTDLMKKPIRSIEWSTERLRELSGIPKPRERKKRASNPPWNGYILRK
jgi:hypothetical protein